LIDDAVQPGKDVRMRRSIELETQAAMTVAVVRPQQDVVRTLGQAQDPERLVQGLEKVPHHLAVDLRVDLPGADLHESTVVPLLSDREFRAMRLFGTGR